MTDIIERATQALDGVTEGPWDDKGTDSEDWSVDYPGDCSWCFVGRKNKTPVAILIGKGYRSDRMIDANARFIAASRQLVPDLIAEVQRLRAELTRRDEADRINEGRGK
jgi:hypothetical protein